MSGKKLDEKFREIFDKCRRWIDDEPAADLKFGQKTWSEAFVEGMRQGLEQTMIQKKHRSFDGKICFPTKYFVRISREDLQDLAGILTIVYQDLNCFIRNVFRKYSFKTLEDNFISIKANSNLKRGKIMIYYDWENNLPPQIVINRQSEQLQTFTDVNNLENPVIDAVLCGDEFNTDGEDETVYGTNLKRFFSLDVWKNGIFQNTLPILQPEINIGRGSVSERIDILLSDDLEISRHHATLTLQDERSLSLSITGQNPAIVRGSHLFAGQYTYLQLEEPFQIGSYLLKAKA
jgi:hypothetical protein